jgi:hypothetical protein
LIIGLVALSAGVLLVACFVASIWLTTAASILVSIGAAMLAPIIVVGVLWLKHNHESKSEGLGAASAIIPNIHSVTPDH